MKECYRRDNPLASRRGRPAGPENVPRAFQRYDRSRARAGPGIDRVAGAAERLHVLAESRVGILRRIGLRPLDQHLNEGTRFVSDDKLLVIRAATIRLPHLGDNPPRAQ